MTATEHKIRIEDKVTAAAAGSPERAVRRYRPVCSCGRYSAAWGWTLPNAEQRGRAHVERAKAADARRARIIAGAIGAPVVARTGPAASRGSGTTMPEQLGDLRVAMAQLEIMNGQPALLRIGGDVAVALAMIGVRTMMPTEWNGQPAVVDIPVRIEHDLASHVWQVVDGDGNVIRSGRLR